MTINKLSIAFLLFFLPKITFAQKVNINYDLSSKMQLLCSGKYDKFHKAHTYFSEKKWDSAYYYSSINANHLVKPIKVYNTYIHGVSAYYKKFYSIAQAKLKTIPNNFVFNYEVWLKLGAVAFELKETDEAIQYLNKILNDKTTPAKIKGVAFHDLGSCYMYIEKYDKAEQAIHSALKIAKAQNDSIQIVYNTLDLGNVYYEQYLDDKAIPLFEEAYILANQLSDLTLQRVATYNLAIVEKNRNDFKKSISYFLAADKLKDSLWNRDKVSLLLEKDKQFALAVKEKEIQLEKTRTLEQKKQRNWFIGLGGLLLVFAGVLFYYYRDKSKKNKVISAQKQELEVLNTTKNYLFSVISHDLRSPVNTLITKQNQLQIDVLNKNSVSIKDTIDKNIAITQSIKHLLNNVLNWSLQQNNQLLFMQKPLNASALIHQVLVDFENFALAKQIQLKSNLNDDILIHADGESIKIILRNLLDNAIKYSPLNSEITVTTTITSNTYCVIKITDNGKGMATSQLSSIQGLTQMSIDNIDRSNGVGLGFLLCVTLVKKNDGKIEFISKLDKGTTVLVYLPIATDL